MRPLKRRHWHIRPSELPKWWRRNGQSPRKPWHSTRTAPRTIALFTLALVITPAAISVPAATVFASIAAFPVNAAERSTLTRRQGLDDSAGPGQQYSARNGQNSTAFFPSARHGHCAFVERAVLYILGGTDDVDGKPRDLPSRQNFFAWDPLPTDGSRPERVRWSRVSVQGFKPVFGHTCTVLPESRRVIVLGRNRPEYPFLQIFDLNTHQWLGAANFTPYPGGKEPSLWGHVAGLVDESHIVVSGGQWVGQGPVRYGRRFPNPFTFILDVQSWEWLLGSMDLGVTGPSMSALIADLELERRRPPQPDLDDRAGTVQQAPLSPTQSPPAGLTSAASWVHGGRLFVAGGSRKVGGSSPDSAMPTAWSYGLEGGWKAEPALNDFAAGIFGMACVAVNETTIFCDGGGDDSKPGVRLRGRIVDFSSFPPRILSLDPAVSTGLQGHTLEVLQDGTLVAFGGFDASVKPQNKLAFLSVNPPAFSWQYPVNLNLTPELDEPDFPTQPGETIDGDADGSKRNLVVYALLATMCTLLCAFAAVCLGGKVSARRQPAIPQRPLVPAMRRREAIRDDGAGFTSIGSTDADGVGDPDDNDEPIEVLRSAPRPSTEDAVLSDIQPAMLNRPPVFMVPRIVNISRERSSRQPLPSPSRDHAPRPQVIQVPRTPRSFASTPPRPPLRPARTTAVTASGKGERVGHRLEYRQQQHRRSDPSARLQSPPLLPGRRSSAAEPRASRLSQPFASSPLAHIPPRTMISSSSRSGSSDSGSGDNEGDTQPLHAAVDRSRGGESMSAKHELQSLDGESGICAGKAR